MAALDLSYSKTASSFHHDLLPSASAKASAEASAKASAEAVRTVRIGCAWRISCIWTIAIASRGRCVTPAVRATVGICSHIRCPCPGIIRITESPASTCHRAHSSWSGSVESWHFVHLLSAFFKESGCLAFFFLCLCRLQPGLCPSGQDDPAS
jgi:hypothetical protein